MAGRKPLTVINAVGALLTSSQRHALIESTSVRRVYEDHLLRTDGGGGHGPASMSGPAGIDPDAPCAVVGSGTLDITGKKVRWKLTDLADVGATITRISIVWPAANGALEKIKSGSREILKQTLAPSSAFIESGWRGSERDRQIKPGKSLTLSFEFAASAQEIEAGYSIQVDFAEDCSASLGPEPTDNSTPGDDPEDPGNGDRSCLSPVPRDRVPSSKVVARHGQLPRQSAVFGNLPRYSLSDHVIKVQTNPFQ